MPTQDPSPPPAPDRDRIALLTVEAQRDTLPGGARPVAGNESIVLRIEAALRAFRQRDDLIVHAVRLYLPDGSNAEPARRARAMARPWLFAPGTEGAELCKELVPNPLSELDPPLLLAGGLQELGPNEFAMYKPRWGAFYGTDLFKLLEACRVRTIAVCGSQWPEGPRATVYEASERDLGVVVLADATSGLYDRGIAELEAIGAWCATVEKFIAWFRHGQPLEALDADTLG